MHLTGLNILRTVTVLRARESERSDQRVWKKQSEIRICKLTSCLPHSILVAYILFKFLVYVVLFF